MLSEKIIKLVREAINLSGDPASHRVVVAMSGGVDSSVAAGLVKMAGFETIGITLQLYDHGAAIAKKGACCAGQDIHDARRVCDTLGIAHYVLDYESKFREAVIDDFVDSYMKGETPIPCVTCNQTVKFADLLAQAKDLGADCLVTGHYVENRPRTDAGADGEAGEGAPLHYDMLTPVDMARDQSYFLFATTQDQLDFLRFPLARLSKDETREIANELGLDIAHKPDSQDICFVPEGNYADLIKKMRPDAEQAGDIIHVDGRALGAHDGIVNFTIGQRRGIGVSDNAPLYVTQLDPKTATVYVGPREALKRDMIALKNINWISDARLEEFDNKREIYVKLRSTRPARKAYLIQRDGDIVIKLDEADYGISAGQACVIYEQEGIGAKVLGGGFIAGATNSGDHN